MTESITSKLVISAVFLAALFFAGLGFYWDKEPEPFNVADKSAAMMSTLKLSSAPGTAITATMITMVDKLFTKRGGYIANDVMLPGVLMDNIPSWEYGVIIQIRDMTRLLKDKMSQSSTEKTEDRDLSLADARFGIEYTSWAMPNAESEFHEGNGYLQDYLKRLGKNNAHFYASAENLHDWLSFVSQRLENLSIRLESTRGDSNHGKGKHSRISRMKVDNVFYEARGSAWALVHLLKAAEIDFMPVLKDKNIRQGLDRAIADLEASQHELGSPIVLNGDTFGVLANHSLQMDAYISAANLSITDVKHLLEKN